VSPNASDRPLHVLVAIFSEMAAWTIPDAHIDQLRSTFPTLTFVAARTEDEMERLIAPCEVAFTSRLTAQAFARAPELRWVHSPAAGVGAMLFQAMREGDVVLSNSRGMNAATVAEHALLLMLAAVRRLPAAVRAQDRQAWIPNALSGLPTLRGRTLGVVGLGAIGREVACLASAFGMRVIGTRRDTSLPPPVGVDLVLAPADLPVLLAQADIVLLAAPLTAETRGMIGAAQLAQMKPTAWLVNVARGKLVREPALVAALEAGTIAGAALDVVAHEPLDPASPLWILPNVLLTPHVAGFREDYWDSATALFAENLTRYLRSESMANIVDKLAGY
jgi:phosphoglycerate dehydrogenase-like enzyme